MGASMIYVGIAVGVVGIAAAMVFATQNQENYIPDDAVAAPATVQGSIQTSELGPTINKEQWHEDPFGDLAAEVRAKAGA